MEGENLIEREILGALESWGIKALEGLGPVHNQQGCLLGGPGTGLFL